MSLPVGKQWPVQGSCAHDSRRAQQERMCLVCGFLFSSVTLPGIFRLQ